MIKITALIVDDEPLARELIKEYLDGLTFIDVVAECSNGFEALKSIQELRPDLIFLDVQMPRIDGFELLEVLDDPPRIIFTTAFDHYALRAFEANAVDYLLKPFSKERFVQAVEKAYSRINSEGVNTHNELDNLKETLSQESISRIIVRQGSKVILIPLDEVMFLESQDDYVMIHSSQGRYLKEKTMQYFESALPSDRFVRIHRSYLVNIEYITSISLFEKNTHLVVLKNGIRLRASQEGYKRLRSFF